jgi:hypothetical protein
MPTNYEAPYYAAFTIPSFASSLLGLNIVMNTVPYSLGG